MMNNATAALVACGDIGMRLAKGLHDDGWRCLGLRRNPQQLPAYIEPVAADLNEVASLQVLCAERPALLLFTPTPASRSAEGYAQGFARAARNIVTALNEHHPALALLVSSTRVYAEHDGGWVDEGSALNRDDPAARAIVEAEEAFLTALPTAVVLRAGGLYGDGPGYLVRRVGSGDHSASEPLRFSNRIHRDDLVGFMQHLLTLERRERIYNLVDNDPAPQHEVEHWLCEQMKLPWRPAAGVADAARGHKRVSNQRLRDSGYVLQYPDYRTGYTQVLRSAG